MVQIGSLVVNFSAHHPDALLITAWLNEVAIQWLKRHNTIDYQI